MLVRSAKKMGWRRKHGQKGMFWDYLNRESTSMVIADGRMSSESLAANGESLVSSEICAEVSITS